MSQLNQESGFRVTVIPQEYVPPEPQIQIQKVCCENRPCPSNFYVDPCSCPGQSGIMYHNTCIKYSPYQKKCAGCDTNCVNKCYNNCGGCGYGRGRGCGRCGPRRWGY